MNHLPALPSCRPSSLLAVGRERARAWVDRVALLVIGSMASLAANVAVAEPTATGRVIAAWPSFALIAAYEMLMRQVRHNAARPGRSLQGGELRQDRGPVFGRHTQGSDAESDGQGTIGRDLQRRAWQWAQANRASDGSLPSGRVIGRQFGRDERWGRFVKRSGRAGELASGIVRIESGLRLVEEGSEKSVAGHGVS